MDILFDIFLIVCRRFTENMIDLFHSLGPVGKIFMIFMIVMFILGFLSNLFSIGFNDSYEEDS